MKLNKQPTKAKKKFRNLSFLLIFVFILLLVPGLSILSQKATAISLDIVISQVYGGGGNSGSTYRNDFIELFNRGSATVSVSGWTVQYASATGNSWATTSLSGNIAPGQYFLVQEGGGTGGTTNLPTPDVTGAINLSATTGKVALVRTSNYLVCGSGIACLPNADIVDFVGYGSSADNAENTPVAALSNTTAALRLSAGCRETNNNNSDFTITAPIPRNSATTLSPCNVSPTPSVPPVGYTPIYTIQGAGLRSPYENQLITTEGVVTAIKSSSGVGFFMQDPSGDGNNNTSDAIFVFTSTTPTVTVGNRVRVSGAVTEYQRLPADQPLTEITSATITDLGASQLLPTSVRISLTTSGAGIRQPPLATIYSTSTFDPTTDALDFYESLEGMLVRVDNAVVVGPTSSGSEFWIVPDNGIGASGFTTRSAIAISSDDFNPERILVDNNVLGSPNPQVALGDRITAPITGLLDYGSTSSSSGQYRLQTVAAITAIDTSQRPPQTSLTALSNSNYLRIASYNIENFNALPENATRLAVIADHIRLNLGAPDILTLVEVQDDNGTGTGITTAEANMSALSVAISSAGGPAYSWRYVSPQANQDGGAINGNIRVVFFYRTDRGLSFVERGSAGPTDATQVNADGSLTLSPGRVDPTNSAFLDSRKPLAGEFSFNGQRLIVIANHFNSRIGDDSLYGSNQPPVLNTEAKRLNQARVVRTFVNMLLTADPNARVVVTGDLNDYEFSAAARILKQGAADLPVSPAQGLIDAVENVALTAGRYTYIYEGNAQTIDHIFYSNTLSPQVVTSAIVHLNAGKLASDLSRASDHEAVVTDFDFTQTSCNPYIIKFTSDDGTDTCGNLSFALKSAATNGNPLVITFASNVAQLTINVSLPALTSGVSVDAGCRADTATGRGIPKVRLLAGNGLSGDALQLSGNNSINGLSITGFSGAALHLSGSNNTVTCNWLGSADGLNPASNGTGVRLAPGANNNRFGTEGNQIGGNLISGNTQYGIWAEGGVGNKFYYNLIGYNSDGQAYLRNGASSLLVLGGAQLQFGKGNRIAVHP
ncbi:MAG: lamin tail domain-containing protein [Chloroflexi bacterium]|uniref:Lamin tail domain-containing protein n=1 Tax=Candidatus Chlorohelix allophototropha TaxID=3003348 RepID=A0A8T7LX70_9CHLR|nr:lamin tail domain-containing protein [Chloroflexota bacterium]WJW67341.1 lamin tail domain-containing protein [Chloroflexota bacterium L227-S17]